MMELEHAEVDFTKENIQSREEESQWNKIPLEKPVEDLVDVQLDMSNPMKVTKIKACSLYKLRRHW